MLVLIEIAGETDLGGEYPENGAERRVMTEERAEEVLEDEGEERAQILRIATFGDRIRWGDCE